MLILWILEGFTKIHKDSYRFVKIPIIFTKTAKILKDSQRFHEDCVTVVLRFHRDSQRLTKIHKDS